MATTTREVLRQDSAKLLMALLWSGTATGGSTTTLVHSGDLGLRDSGLSSFLFSGAYVLCTSGTDDGDWRQVPRTGFAASTGTITFNEAFVTGFANGTTYEILTLLDPTQWNDVLNDALIKLRYNYRSPLTLVTDGDMETSGTTNWTASNSTRTKETSLDFVEGTQALRVANSSAAGYVQSASIPCQAGQSFHVWASYKSVVGTAVLRAYDVTGSASIESDSGPDSGTNNEGGMIHFAFTAPASCRNVAIRLEGTEASADIYWDDVIVMRSGRSRYELPSWVTERDQVTEFQIRSGSRPAEFDWGSTGWPVELEENLAAVNTFRVMLPNGTPRPIYVAGARYYESLATDAATTTCPREWARYAVASEVLQRYPRAIQDYSKSGVAIDEQHINNRFTLLTRRYMPRAPKPIGFKDAWVTTVGSPW